MTAALTRSLLAAAVIATALDIVAYLVFVAPGIAVELNPIIARLDSAAAVGARIALVVLLWSLTVVAGLANSRLLTLWVSVMLATAIVVGVLGAASTLGAVAV